MNFQERRGATPRLLDFVREQADSVLKHWLARSRAAGLSLKEPTSIFEAIVGEMAARAGEAGAWSADALRPDFSAYPAAELRKLLDGLERGILELWTANHRSVVRPRTGVRSRTPASS